jgi:hypothetical protein
MPAKTKKQQKFFGAELGRAESGQKTETGLGVGKLKEMAAKPKGGYKKKAKKKA